MIKENNSNSEEEEDHFSDQSSLKEEHGDISSHNRMGEESDDASPRNEDSLYISVSVSDTGCGMDDQMKRTCFTLFGNLKFKKDINQGGMGLGLASANLICRALNGELNLIRSEVGEGSKFQFSMGIQMGQEIIEMPRNETETNEVDNKNEEQEDEGFFDEDEGGGEDEMEDMDQSEYVEEDTPYGDLELGEEEQEEFEEDKQQILEGASSSVEQRYFEKKRKINKRATLKNVSQETFKAQFFAQDDNRVDKFQRIMTKQVLSQMDTEECNRKKSLFMQDEQISKINHQIAQIEKKTSQFY